MELLPLIRMSVVFPFDISIGNIEILATWGTQDKNKQQKYNTIQKTKQHGLNKYKKQNAVNPGVLKDNIISYY